MEVLICAVIGAIIWILLQACYFNAWNGFGIIGNLLHKPITYLFPMVYGSVLGAIIGIGVHFIRKYW
jgi:hypothetical protein